MKCPIKKTHDDGTTEKCEFESDSLREVERHRHEEHDAPLWEAAYENDGMEPPEQ
jgi:hypothetical protein